MVFLNKKMSRKVINKISKEKLRKKMRKENIQKVATDTCQDPISEEARLEFYLTGLIVHDFI